MARTRKEDTGIYTETVQTVRAEDMGAAVKDFNVANTLDAAIDAAEANALAVLGQHNIDLVAEAERFWRSHSAAAALNVCDRIIYCDSIPASPEERGLAVLLADRLDAPRRRHPPIVSDAAEVLVLVKTIRERITTAGMPTPKWLSPDMAAGWQRVTAEMLALDAFRLGAAADRLIVRPHEPAAKTGRKVHRGARQAAKQTNAPRQAATRAKAAKLLRRLNELKSDGWAPTQARRRIANETGIPYKTVLRLTS